MVAIAYSKSRPQAADLPVASPQGFGDLGRSSSLPDPIKQRMSPDLNALHAPASSPDPLKQIAGAIETQKGSVVKDSDEDFVRFDPKDPSDFKEKLSAHIKGLPAFKSPTQRMEALIDEFVEGVFSSVQKELSKIDPSDESIAAVSKDLTSFCVSMPGHLAKKDYFNDSWFSKLLGRKKSEGLKAYEQSFSASKNKDLDYVGESSADLLDNLENDCYRVQALYKLPAPLAKFMDSAKLPERRFLPEELDELQAQFASCDLELAFMTIANDLKNAAEYQANRLGLQAQREVFVQPHLNAAPIDYSIMIDPEAKDFVDMQIEMIDFLLQVDPDVKVVFHLGPPGKLPEKHTVLPYKWKYPVRDKDAKWQIIDGDLTIVTARGVVYKPPANLPGVLAVLQANYGSKLEHPESDSTIIDLCTKWNQAALAKGPVNPVVQELISLMPSKDVLVLN